MMTAEQAFEKLVGVALALYHKDVPGSPPLDMNVTYRTMWEAIHAGRAIHNANRGVTK